MSQEGYSGYIRSLSGGGMGDWFHSPRTLSANISEAGGMALNGYVYFAGGIDSVPAELASIEYASVDGEDVGAFSTTTDPLPAVKSKIRNSTLVYNDRLYVFGGVDATDADTDTVYYASPDGDGDITGGWTTNGTALPAVASFVAVTNNGSTVYVLGGDSTGALDTVHYGTIAGDGSIASFTATTVMPSGRFDGKAFVHNGYLFYVGGTTDGTTYLDEVISAKINTDGTVGSWTVVSNMPRTPSKPNIVYNNGYIYVMGGDDVNYATVMVSQVNRDGTVGSWEDVRVPFPSGHNGGGSVAVYNNYVYVAGGAESGSSDSSAIHSSELLRHKQS